VYEQPAETETLKLVCPPFEKASTPGGEIERSAQIYLASENSEVLF
jgi:hypothetical protein